MSTMVWVACIVAGLVLIAAAIYARHIIEKKRRRSLQTRFLSEYDRTVQKTGDRRAAERELQGRIDKYDNVVRLHDIDATRKEVIRAEWLSVQVSFVDDPRRAISKAARVVHDAMTERGYPDNDAGEQIDLISVDHPDLVPEFRRAHISTFRGRSGDADTEELRQAFLRYRAVFNRLLDPPAAKAARS